MHMNNQMNDRMLYFSSLLRRQPDARAILEGSPSYASIRGRVAFYQTPFGVLAATEVYGLPSNEQPCASRIFALHIHEGSSCTGNAEDPFADAMTHYNPNNCDHPFHAGDMPPLFDANGYSFSAFLSNRFTVKEIIGRTVILHAGIDDFTSQPAGNAGKKIACGKIMRLSRNL